MNCIENHINLYDSQYNFSLVQAVKLLKQIFRNFTLEKNNTVYTT